MIIIICFKFRDLKQNNHYTYNIYFIQNKTNYILMIKFYFKAFKLNIIIYLS